MTVRELVDESKSRFSGNAREDCKLVDINGSICEDEWVSRVELLENNVDLLMGDSNASLFKVVPQQKQDEPHYQH